MKIVLDLNPDEALALIQICEHDIWHPDVAQYVINEVERYRHEWARHNQWAKKFSPRWQERYVAIMKENAAKLPTPTWSKKHEAP